MKKSLGPHPLTIEAPLLHPSPLVRSLTHPENLLDPTDVSILVSPDLPLTQSLILPSMLPPQMRQQTVSLLSLIPRALVPFAPSPLTVLPSLLLTESPLRILIPEIEELAFEVSDPPHDVTILLKELFPPRLPPQLPSRLLIPPTLPLSTVIPPDEFVLLPADAQRPMGRHEQLAQPLPKHPARLVLEILPELFPLQIVPKRVLHPAPQRAA